VTRFERTSTVSYGSSSVIQVQQQSQLHKQEQEQQIIIKHDNDYRMQQHLLDQLALLQEMRRKLDTLIAETQQMLNE
jgi:hypothetical protein